MKKIIIYTIIIICFLACKKQNEWLDIKSNKADVIPSSLSDFQALLDNNDIMNANYPAIGIIGADNSFVLDAVATTSGSLNERNAYKWAKDIYENEIITGVDWQYPYRTIEYANVVLDGLSKLNVAVDNDYNNIKGQALFFRGFAYYQLLQIFSKSYEKTTATSDLGVPLKLNADVNSFLKRSSIQEVYDQIITDVQTAEALLYSNQLYKTRPSKIAAQALLAKSFLNMKNYEKANDYADLVLKTNNGLIDLNSLNSSLAYPFPTFQSNTNPEILFYATAFNWTLNNINNLLVVDDLYGMYQNDDLRKVIFFRTNTNGTFSFKGRYAAGVGIFCGISVNEVYLIRAECLARTGQYIDAMNYINFLLKQRWKKVNGLTTYVDQSANDEDTALRIILNERRKELPFTGNLRWEDLKRLNSDPRFSKTLTRTISNQQYSLPPDDNRYLYPIPPLETNFNSNIIQNQR